MIMSRIFSSAEPGPQLTWTAMICYNGDYTLNNDCLTATVATPIKWTSRNDALNTDPTGSNPIWYGIQTTYDCNATPANCYGNVTEEDDYNYGPAGGHMLLRKTIINYDGYPLDSGDHNR
jgi:hypothetical protein